MRKGTYPHFLFILIMLSFAFSNTVLAGNSLRPLYLDANPSGQISVSGYDIRIVGMNPSDETVCVAWNVDISSQIECTVPFKIDFYDRKNQFIGQHEQTFKLNIGTTTVKGVKWLHCPEYFANAPKKAMVNRNI